MLSDRGAVLEISALTAPEHSSRTCNQVLARSSFVAIKLPVIASNDWRLDRNRAWSLRKGRLITPRNRQLFIGRAREHGPRRRDRWTRLRISDDQAKKFTLNGWTESNSHCQTVILHSKRSPSLHQLVPCILVLKQHSSGRLCDIHAAKQFHKTKDTFSILHA
ncbi:hypothetical protein PM082_007269 [Marasmius tenuissimus]|nr:hypothetical protein PM082_007269 [Marasmius tenuissimus]